MSRLFTSPVCPMGHGKLRRYTIGSRLIVEAVLIAFLIAIYLAASFFNFGPSTTVAVVVLLVLVLACIALLDFFVLKYRCSTCGQAFTRQAVVAQRDTTHTGRLI